MQITKENLQGKLADLEKDAMSLQSQLIAMQGAKQILLQLIKEADEPEPITPEPA